MCPLSSLQTMLHDHIFDTTAQNFCRTSDWSSPLNCTVYLSLYLGYCCNSREHLCIRHFCTLFEYVLHYSQGNERMGDIRSSCIDVTLLDPFSSDSVMQQKWQCFGAIFEISSGHRKLRILSESKIFFTEVFEIKSRFVLVEKIWGLGAF